MSKKTVVFNSPAKGGPRGEAPRTAAGSGDAALEAAWSPAPPSEAVNASPDQWVRDRHGRGVTERPATADGVVIDLAARRDLFEAAALMVLVPPVLGWFWLYNLVGGERPRLG